MDWLTSLGAGSRACVDAAFRLPRYHQDPRKVASGDISQDLRRGPVGPIEGQLDGCGTRVFVRVRLDVYEPAYRACEKITSWLRVLKSMADYYKSICELTLKYRDNKEASVRKAVIGLIPNIATFDSEAFEAHYLHRSMGYLLQALGKPTDRDLCKSSFTTITQPDGHQHTFRWAIWPFSSARR